MSESFETQRNIWAQLSISACALLLPPIALGAAVFSMLPARDDGAERLPAGAAAEAQGATSKSWVHAVQARSVKADSPPATHENAPLATSKAASDGRSVSPANARQEAVSKKDMARVLSSVPVRVTVVTPPAAGNPSLAIDVDSVSTGAIGVQPWQSTAVETPTALLPRALTPPVQVAPVQVAPVQVAPVQLVPQLSATQGAATQMPTADRSSAEGRPPPASTTRKRAQLSYLRTLAGRSGARADARGETQTVHRNAQPQQTFSLKDWLQKLGTAPRDPRS